MEGWVVEAVASNDLTLVVVIRRAECIVVVLGVREATVEYRLLPDEGYILDMCHATIVAVVEARYGVSLHTHRCCNTVEAVNYHYATLGMGHVARRKRLRVEALATIVYGRYAVAIYLTRLLA